MNIITTGAVPQIMTSLELVDFINNERMIEAAGKHFPLLAHADFCKKVVLVLGEGAGNFSDTYQNPQNKQTYPIYRFPKREACLMAMSYSYDLQAKVFDRMTALEASAPARVMSPGEMFLQNAQAMVAMEKTIAEQGNQIANQAEAIKRIESKQSAYDNGASFFTVIGFGVHRGISFGLTDAAALGRVAAKLSKEKGIAVDKVKDPRFGSVNSYHESMLDAALTKIHGGM